MPEDYDNREEIPQNLSGEMSEAELDEVSGGNSKLDSLSELSEEQQLRMQMVMERMTKFNSMSSNVSKKLSNTTQSITQNLK